MSVERPLNPDYLKASEGARQRNYKAWEVKLEDFPKKGSLRDQLQFFLKFAVLAPSTHNTQPWIFEILEVSGHKAKLLAKPDFERSLPATDPRQRNIYISLGCAITNMRVVAENCGFVVRDNFVKSEDGFAVELSFERSESSEKLGELAPFITERFSDKGSYSSEAIPPKVLAEFQEALSGSGFTVNFVTDDGARKSIAKLYRQAGLQFTGQKQFLRELSRWLRPNNTFEPDGMPGFIAGLSQLASIIGRKLISFLPLLSRKQIAKDANHLERGPVIGVISSANDEPTDHIRAGELYQKLALLCTKEGISITPMTAIVESNLRPELTELFESKLTHPQMFFRMGYGLGPRYHTPRRPVETMLEE